MWYPEENERSLSWMFDHCTLEALLMYWLKRDMRKAGIAIASMLLLLVLMTWVPVSAVGAYEGTSGLAMSGMGTAQTTPTEDATVSALNKEKLEQEVQQLKNQNEPDFLGWLRTNASILLSTLVIVIGGLIGLFRWLGDRRDEREKRAEERFQSAVTGLGNEKEGARIGAAILLRTFLRPGYEQFYIQTFDLAVANLCPTETPNPPESPEIPLPLTTLRQALIAVFKEAFPLARSQHKGSPQSLDASYIQLDSAYLRRADLKQVWLPEASLRYADLSEANLSGAKLWRADLSGADLSGANLHEANLRGVTLEGTLLKDTNLRRTKGLTREQLEACKAKGAIIDEDPTTTSSQSTTSPPPSSQSNDSQAQSIPSAQESIPTADPGPKNTLGEGSTARSDQK
jgi:Pentapeptide repeats (8 copies)